MTNSKIADRRLPWLRYISHLADKWLLWGKFSGKISAHLIEQYLSMRSGKKNLTILSEAERAALYESPDFDHEQRLEYLNFSADEQTLMRGRPHLAAQIHCALQIGYFKAKHLFFRVDWQEAEEDVAFILEQYFPNQTFHQESITKHQYYVQCQLISQHFNWVQFF